MSISKKKQIITIMYFCIITACRNKSYLFRLPVIAFILRKMFHALINKFSILRFSRNSSLYIILMVHSCLIFDN